MLVIRGTHQRRARILLPSIMRSAASYPVRRRLICFPWGRAQEEVRNGIAQGIFVVGWNEERAQWLYFSPPILNSEYGFFVKNDNPLKFRQVSDVKGYMVGVYGPSNTATSLEKIKSEIKDLTITDKKLVEQFNQTFRNLHKRGIIQEILSKYEMDAAPFGVSGLLLSVYHC